MTSKVAKKTVEEKYKKHELKNHILSLPDTYIGSCESTLLKLYLYNNDEKKMVESEITYVPGLLKIFDEIIVNAIDHAMRLKSEAKDGKENIKHTKNIKVTINKETGYITIYNDGDGIDVEKHATYNDIWVPELIFGELLTSTNYDKNEEKIWGGKNGYGAKLTNIFSKEFTVETIDHNRKRSYIQTFKNNLSEKDKPVIKASSKAPYTQISFLPDYERFGLKNITEDIYKLFHRRIIDCCATTEKDVSVYFNDEKLAIKDFEKYSELFLEKESQPHVYENVNERWEVVVALSKTGIYEQISFVNGINTLRGGKHVDYITNMVVKNLCETALAKKKKTIKPQHIKDNIFVFIKSIIVNPSFDSQSKETLTTPVAKFGSKCELSDKFFDKLYKCGIVDKAISLTEFHEEKKLVKTDGKKVSKLIIPKLDDANLAGTKNSTECTLILTEGDSAKTMAIAGLSVIGRDRYGVFPLRGKIMNVKDAAIQKISDNNEITAIKKIMGLEQNKKYTDLNSLRYGSIMLMVDQDNDGSHIKGLLFNVFQSLWPSLYKIEGFLTSMLTPIIKVSNSKGEVISFYNQSDYKKWSETDIAKKGAWKIKYYKGLGTSDGNEAKDYFKHMKKITYKYTEESDESIDLAFNKKRADDRKVWLMKYDKTDVLDYTRPVVNYETFINKDLIHFSNRDLERSINHICDGLKESTRKILFACFKRKLFTNELKVAQLAGNVSEVSAYHHGETSLQQAIIGMAQIYVGTNNINILMPNGQFGGRIQGGNDASSARYIYTLISKLTRLIYKEEDNCILNYLEDDGVSIEPEYYAPIIPMILVNGGLGIGTGFSTNIPQYNPEDIIKICNNICDNIDKEIGKINSKDDLERTYNVIKSQEIINLTPWYLGFQGVIDKCDKSFTSKGVYNWISDSSVIITELPIGTWTDDYKEFLEGLIINNSPLLKTFESHYTSMNVKFILHFNAGARAKMGDKFETEFKLVSSKNLSINNMHLYSEKNAIKKYENTSNIIKEWSLMRIQKYYERKEYQINLLEKEFNILSAKIRFILDVINGIILIMNKKMVDVAEQLTTLKYPKILNDEDKDTDDDDKKSKGYNYLLRMPIYHLTYEKKSLLEKEVSDLEDKLKNLKETSIQQIWRDELNALLVAWKEHRDAIELEYSNDKSGIVEKVEKKKKTTKVAK